MISPRPCWDVFLSSSYYTPGSLIVNQTLGFSFLSLWWSPFTFRAPISYQSIGRSAFSYLHPLVWPTNDTQIRHSEIGCDIFICHVHSKVFICIDGMKKRAHPAEAQGSPLLELWAMRVTCCRLFLQNPELQTISPMHFVFFQKCFLLSPELNSSLTSISAKPTLLFTTLKFIHSSYKN